MNQPIHQGTGSDSPIVDCTQLFDAIPGYATLQSRDLHVLAANRNFREDFGDFSGRYCYQVYKHRPEKCEECPVEKTFRDGQMHSSEETIQCRDGREFQVVVKTSPIRDANGDISAVLEVSTDVTDIKDLQSMYRASKQRYQNLFEEVPCYISIQDKDLNIVDANRWWREAFGSSLGMKCYQAYKHRSVECSPCIVRQTMQDGQVHHHEEIVTDVNGHQMHVLVHTMPIRDEHGNIVQVIEMSTDISEIRELQSQLANLGLLISSVSHGIKGVLNGLDGGIYLVSKGLQNDRPERVEQGWEIVLRNVKRIRSMILDILYYAKDREPNYDKISSLQSLEDVFGLAKDNAYDSGIQIDIEPESEDAEFEADESAVRSLLVNLVENSIDACRVDTKKNLHQVRLQTYSDEEQVHFRVSDNGIGMNRETREKAFTLFFSSKGADGTGLGLFISDKIARAHGGSINVESEEGEGTTFHVLLPRKKQTADSSHTKNEPERLANATSSPPSAPGQIPSNGG